MSEKIANEYESLLAIRTLHAVEDLLCATVLRGKLAVEDKQRCREIIERSQALRREIIGYSRERTTGETENGQ